MSTGARNMNTSPEDTCPDCGKVVAAGKLSSTTLKGRKMCRVCAMLRWRYGLSNTQYMTLWDTQGGKCAICPKLLAEDWRPSVDHDHSCCPSERSCGLCVRGILCNNCNVALGCVNDSSRHAALSLEYLQRPRVDLVSLLGLSEFPLPTDVSGKCCTKCGLFRPMSQFPLRTKSRTPYSWCARCVCLHKYGLTQRTYLALQQVQGSECAMCRSKPSTSHSFAVDHDHSCCAGRKTCGGCLRGLLCSDCNRFIGYVKDDLDTIKNMVVYLEKSIDRD